jgi:hypothetical protein
MSNISIYPWQAYLRDAFAESDPRKLRGKIQKVEVALFQRAQTLSLGRDHLEEREALIAAIARLRDLQKEKPASFKEDA